MNNNIRISFKVLAVGNGKVNKKTKRTNRRDPNGEEHVHTVADNNSSWKARMCSG